MILDILLWIILGALAGWIASKVMNTDAEQGAIANIVVGILGALIGGFIMQALTGANTASGSNIFVTLLTAIVGAIILLAIVKAFRRGSAHRA